MGVEIRFPAEPDWSNPLLVQFEQAQLLYRNASLVDVVAGAQGHMSYLATPYSKVCVKESGDWDQVESLLCAGRAARWSRLLAVEGITAISPIIQSVEMVHVDFDDWLDPLDAKFWTDWCQPLLNACGSVIVPPIAGWRASQGVWQEVVSALRGSRPVFLIDPKETPQLARWLDT
jgi:hypothetical protein